jgi:hypothetical protein
MNTHEEHSPEVIPAGAIAQIEQAQIDTQIATARRYPRNIAKVKAQMLAIATLDEETAAACSYAIPRAGKVITGPSVRLAEIALSAFSNVRAATRILSVHTGENPHAIVQAVCHDLENNVVFAVEKRRRITPKRDYSTNGHKPVDDDDIQLAVNAGSAIAFRDAVFKVVPGALVKPVMEAAKKVAVGDARSFSANRDKILARLRQMGVQDERIFAVIGVTKADVITGDQLETLIGLGTAIKDGTVTIEEAFPPVVREAKAPVFRQPAPTAPTSTPPASNDGDLAPVAPEATAQPAPAPTAPPIVEATLIPATTPHDAIASRLKAEGLDFDDLLGWARTQAFPWAETAASLDEIPTKDAAKLAKGLNAIVTAIKGGAR